jgi:N-sulfoglucosamine sulfohydrolase
MRVLMALLLLLTLTAGISAERPNIVWIVGEDMGPEVRCYGDKYARTPNIDKLAGEGARFRRAFTHAPVCAPSRSGLITGRYPTSIGTHHMRSKLLKPPPTFTQRLREAGYFVSWPGKTDFNFDVPKEAFDSTANWRTQAPRQPFFAYINLNTTHESQIRGTPAQFAKNTAKLTTEDRHDPTKARLPPYYPDTAETRRDWANYYDLVTAVDYQVREVLTDLERLGVASNTAVFFFGDHGRGLPRGKRWVYDSGIHVPLIVRWPGRIKPGTVRDDLVAFVDFAPTVLSMAGGAAPPEWEGQIFLGPKRAAERKYIFAARDRMDEAYDRIRCVRDKGFKYIRNFHPELPYAQRIDYMEEMPTTRVWREWNAEGKLNKVQKLWFAKTKPAEELYDLERDPHEINNLAASARQRKKLNELRGALDQWVAETGDMGAVAETEMIARGLVADKLTEYQGRVKPLPEKLKL